jgi:hypothetical protein
MAISTSPPLRKTFGGEVEFFFADYYSGKGMGF